MSPLDPTKPQREVRSLTPDEERRLLAYLEGRALKAEATGAWHPIRIHVMIQTFLGTGLRCAELAALTCGDLQVGRGESALVVQRGKGGKRRMVGIGPALKALLRQFLDHKEARGESAQADAPVFASERGGGPLDPSAIWRAVAQAYRAVGVRGANVHSLRHTHARRLLASGADLAAVQHQLGHASLATTGIYLKPTLEDRVQAVARMEAARSNGAQGNQQRVADRLARGRRSPANRGRKLAGSGETRPGSPDQAPLAGSVVAGA